MAVSGVDRRLLLALTAATLAHLLLLARWPAPGDGANASRLAASPGVRIALHPAPSPAPAAAPPAVSNAISNTTSGAASDSGTASAPPARTPRPTSPSLATAKPARRQPPRRIATRARETERAKRPPAAVRASPPAAAPVARRADTSDPPERPATATAATTGTAPTTAPDALVDGRTFDRDRAAYLRELAAAIARQRRYPRLSRRLGEQGRVLVGFEVRADGRLADIRVLESSGHPRLDRAAVETVRRASPFRPLPPALRGGDWHIRLPVDFRLRP